MTRCAASIVLSIDPDVGRAIVLFATPALWQYAFARESSEDVSPDALFTLMHALSFKHRHVLEQRKEAARKAAEAKKAAHTKAEGPDEPEARPVDAGPAEPQPAGAGAPGSSP
jgi:hypothetical protein